MLYKSYYKKEIGIGEERRKISDLGPKIGFLH
jgi:hypothetical protein